MTELIKKLRSVPDGQWFSVVTKDGVDCTEIIKQLIDGGEHFTLSHDHKKFQRLDDFEIKKPGK